MSFLRDFTVELLRFSNFWPLKIRETPHFWRFIVLFLAHIFEISSFCSKIIFNQQLFSYCCCNKIQLPGVHGILVLFSLLMCQIICRFYRKDLTYIFEIFVWSKCKISDFLIISARIIYINDLHQSYSTYVSLNSIISFFSKIWVYLVNLWSSNK